MAFEKVEFNFPTEEKGDDLEIESSSAVELDAEIPIDVEIVDDTPEVDRNRTKSKPPSDVTDSELDQYSEKVANRIKHISKGYHDERREKEKVLRERGELESYTRNLMTENEKLRQNVGKSQATMFSQAKIAVGRDMEKAKADYKSAYEAGDADKLVEAQAKISAVTLRIDKLAQIKQPALQNDKNQVQQQQQQQQQQYEQQQRQQQQQAPQVDNRAKEWADENKWFGPNKQMTALALGFHNELVEDHGLNPTSDEYYEKIDSRMREVFPDSFEEASNNDDGQRTRKRTNVVASATRTTAPKKVKLTRSQVSIAKKLGVPLEDYAKQVANDMSRER
jgi:type II secretory pathway pseudopilin PulG